MPPSTPLDSPLADLAPRLEALDARTRAAVAGLDPATLARRPAPDAWSIAEVFEHLCLSHAHYRDRIAAAIARSRARREPARPWRASWVGGFLVRSLDERTGTRPLPAPRVFRPLTPRDGVIDAYLATLAEVRANLRACDGLDLQPTFASPVSPLLRINLGDALAVLVTHGERHVGQVERTRRALGI